MHMINATTGQNTSSSWGSRVEYHTKATKIVPATVAKIGSKKGPDAFYEASMTMLFTDAPRGAVRGW
jgi:hypothetical protein